MQKDFYGIFLKCEQNVIIETHEQHYNWFKLFYDRMNLLMKIVHLPAAAYNVDDENYFSHFFLKESYLQVSHSLRSVQMLLERGQYHDAMILCRSIVENLVNCKYVHKRKEMAEKVLHGKNNKIIISWKDITGNDDAYDVIYRLLCRADHKNFGHGVSQHRLSTSNLSFIEVIPKYSKKLCGFLINYLNYLIYGYINLAVIFFPADWALIDNDKELLFLQDLEKYKIKFRESAEKDKIQFPESIKWREVMEKIIN